MRKWSCVVLFLFFVIQSHQLFAEEGGDENSDLNLIPKSLETVKREPAAAERTYSNGKIFLEDALTGWVNRGLLVPTPIKAPNWQNRTSLDFDDSWQINGNFRLNLSDRLNVLEGNTLTFPSGENIRNDLREGYFSWEFLKRTFLEVGRINLKNGISLGYNPTDYFKSRTTVNIASIDPSALREDRLGSVMVKGEKIWENGAVTLAYSPRLTGQSPLLISQHASFDPLFGQTNSRHRELATLSYNIADLNPQALLFVDNAGTHVGANISRVMSSSVVAYAEWSGVREATLVKRAVIFGENTGTLPQGSPFLPQTDLGKGFRNDLAAGLSWTSSFKLTVNLEYHYHQAGLGAGAFNEWVSLGRSNPLLASELWFIRQYAADQQEPFTQHEIFLRFDWQDIVPSKLNAGGVLFISPYDGSLLTQVSAQYFISRNWTVGLYLGGAIGSTSTLEGSQPWSASGVLQIVRYL